MATPSRITSAVALALLVLAGVGAGEDAQLAALRESYTVRSPADVHKLLRRAATPRKEVLITTLRMDAGGGETLGLARSFASHLHAAGLLQHTLLLTTDPATWQTLHELGLPAYLDAAFPAAFPGAEALPRTNKKWDPKAPTGLNREWDVAKHYWALQALRAGLSVLYLDSDNVVLQNPLPHLAAAGFDVQGLSDWTGAELPPTGGMLDRDCNGLYLLASDGRVEYGSVLRESWTSRPAETAVLPTTSPCQSTGLWYLRPTAAAQRFMEALLARLAQYPWQWEQAAWNQVVQAFLVGMGSDIAPLRYRLLPVESYANVDVFVARVNASLPVDQRALHAGALHGSAKRKAFQGLGVYNAAFELPAPAPNLLAASGLTAAAASLALGGPYDGQLEVAGLIALGLPLAVLAAAVVRLSRRWQQPQGGHACLA